MTKLVMIGGGNMGAALVGGMLESGRFTSDELGIVEMLPARRDQLGEMFPGLEVTAEVATCHSAVLAVKPAGVPAAATAAVGGGATRLLSIAAGVDLATIEAAAGSGVAVVRAMPNTPALVGRGASAVAGGANAGDDDLVWAESILAAVGIVERLAESQLDLFTGLAGSGPAYVFLIAEALIDAAVAEGLPRPTAERVVTQLLLGSSVLLDREGDPARLRANVTSPGGTTAAGLRALEDRAVRSAFAAAVEAATARSRALS